MENVKNIDPEGSFTVCPDCGYTKGFHSVFVGLKHNGPAQWVLICPSCSSKFDIGLRYAPPTKD